MTPTDLAFPPCGPRPRFHDAAGRSGASASGIASGTRTVDASAVFSVLKFGAIVPPLSPWEGVARFVPGYRYQGTTPVGPVTLGKRPDCERLPVERQADLLEGIVDAYLREHVRESDPVLLFSGGVDSGFLASRLAATGYRDALLAHYSFGDDDQESRLAEQMARTLGLRFVRVSGRAAVTACLEAPGKVYPLPFGDYSTAPTTDLALSVLELLDGRRRTIIDGTGADGAFGMIAKVAAWERVFSTPRLVRRAAAAAYGQFLWARSGRLESLGRVLRRAADLSFVAAVVAQNPLAGIFYRCDRRPAVDALLVSWIEGWAGNSPASRVVAADLALTCANVFAQKAFPLYEAAGHRVLFPFLTDDIVSLAVGEAASWDTSEPKACLKASLARHVPRSYVYRTKSGFVDPRGSVFHDRRFLEHLRAVADATSPIAASVCPEPILRACDMLARGRMLPAQTLNLVWALAFTDRWYRTVT